MNQKLRLRRIFSMVLILCLAVAFVGKAQSLPEGRGKAQFQRICGNCHGVNMATSQRMTQAQWTGVVNDMVSRGAQGTQADLDNVVTYLTANFGTDKPAADPAAPAQAPPPVAEHKETPLSDAEVSRGSELLRANGCVSCHRVGDTGAYVGPDLSDIGGRRSAEQIRSPLVSPNKEVIPENRSVRLVTGDGKTVTGRLLNQDGFSVQLIDSSSQLRTFEKAHLREFTIVTANPMPSYANRMNAQDLNDLIHYLSSLKEEGKP
jgi:putative heme-binding domain-containing protein